MRKLSDAFMADLQSGFLMDLPRAVIKDPDLNLEIREHYLSIYYKGNSLLKLKEAHGPHVGLARYLREIHPKFLTDDVKVPEVFEDLRTTQQFVKSIPALKRNIVAVTHGKQSLETEYEQLLIRANNFEARNNSEYFLIDRQYVVGTERFDLIGICWERRHRRRGQEVPLCLMELKFALNPDIADVHDQLARYYDAVTTRVPRIAEEVEVVFRQKLALGLYRQSPERATAMETLTISRGLSQVKFILVLIDYNPYSRILDVGKLVQLPFAGQVEVFRAGFAMWKQHVKPLTEFARSTAG